MALAEQIMAKDFGSDLVDHHTYVFLGEGCLEEGIGQEAISLAGHLGLGKLIMLYDDNGITIDGPTSVSFSDDIPKRLSACGWHVQSCDGHDAASIDAALTLAKAVTNKPSLIAMKTVIGLGSPNKAGTASCHGSPLDKDEAAAAKAALGWTAEPLEIPGTLLQEWRIIGSKGKETRLEWENRLAKADETLQTEFLRSTTRSLPADFKEAVANARKALFDKPQKVATRKASQMALEALAPVLPELIGGSADLTGSNLTRVPSVDSQFRKGTPGRYIGYGMREFAMAAAINGMMVHGGIIPYGGTFMVFSDYARNGIRLSALMGIGTIYVMTHDSIGLGEDGPTHQPVEHLASLRAMPNLLTFRPADALETLECWELAIRNRTRPSLLALSRQAVPQLRLEESDQNLAARGPIFSGRLESANAL